MQVWFDLHHPRLELGILAITVLFLDPLYQICRYNEKHCSTCDGWNFGACKLNAVAASVVEQLLTWSWEMWSCFKGKEALKWAVKRWSFTFKANRSSKWAPRDRFSFLPFLALCTGSYAALSPRMTGRMAALWTSGELVQIAVALWGCRQIRFSHC